MKFFERINPFQTPASISPDDTLKVLRERILQFILLIASVTGLIVIILTTLRDIQRQRWDLIAVYLTIYVITVLIAVFRNLPLNLRTIIVALEVFTIGMVDLLQTGMSGEGRIFLVTFAILTAALLGQGDKKTGFTLNIGIAGIVIALISVWLAAFLMTTGRIPVPSTEEMATSGSFSEWVNGNFVFLLAAGLAVGSVLSLVSGLNTALSRQRDLAGQLSAQSETLEKRVEERTSQISIQNSRLEAANLITQQVFRSTNLEESLNAAVSIISREFQYEHVGIYLLDNSKEFAVLRAAAGEAGKTMLQNGHRLKMGELGIVGFAVSRGEPRIASNVAQDSFYHKNPLLPNTQAEMALPLLANESVIGALDIQSNRANDFTQEEVKILQLITNQLSLAIEKASLMENLQQTVQSLEMVQSQIVWNAWKQHLQQETGLYAYRFKNQKVENVLVHTPESEKALREGKKVIQVHQTDSNSPASTTVSIPIKIQNQVLGVLNVRVNRTQVPQDLLTLLDSSVDRLSLALENARLMEEAQSRADEEHLVSKITARLRSSIDVDSILETAAEELGKSMGVSEVIIQLMDSQS
ncbi:MAG: GAF domain-containing protein [Chloroflexi bacterium]|nr:GAF domain-containing protein [Chloroflexota bacterium]